MRQYLKNLRQEKRITQVEMAKNLEMTQQNYSLIERGARQNDMGIGLLTRLSQTLTVPLEKLICLERSFREEEEE